VRAGPLAGLRTHAPANQYEEPESPSEGPRRRSAATDGENSYVSMY